MPWTFSEPTSWTLKEKLSMGDDDFEILDEDGNTVIEAKGSEWCRSGSWKDDCKDKVTFYDSNTQEELFSMQKKMWQWTPTYKVQMKGNTVAVMTKKMFSMSDSLKVYGGEDKKAPLLFIVKQPFVCNPFKCGFSGRRRIFYAGDTGDELAESKEKRCNPLELFGQDEYDVEVEPGVDCLMVFAVLIALDAMEEDQQQQ
jgi:uncharacterized protein YxjI